MSTIAEVKDLARATKTLDVPGCTCSCCTLARAVLALPDSEVPPGKVLVDEADLRELAEYRTLALTSPSGRFVPGRSRRWHAVFDRILAALPAPEWEPSPEDVENYAECWDHGEDVDGIATVIKEYRDAGWDIVPRRIAPEVTG